MRKYCICTAHTRCFSPERISIDLGTLRASRSLARSLAEKSRRENYRRTHIQVAIAFYRAIQIRRLFRESHSIKKRTGTSTYEGEVETRSRCVLSAVISEFIFFFRAQYALARAAYFTSSLVNNLLRVIARGIIYFDLPVFRNVYLKKKKKKEYIEYENDKWEMCKRMRIAREKSAIIVQLRALSLCHKSDPRDRFRN